MESLHKLSLVPPVKILRKLKRLRVLQYAELLSVDARGSGVPKANCEASSDGQPPGTDIGSEEARTTLLFASNYSRNELVVGWRVPNIAGWGCQGCLDYLTAGSG